MRRLKNALLVLFTLLLVAVGAAMPFAASYLQDARQTGSESRSFDSFSLTLREEADLGRTLELIAGSDYYIAEGEEAADARMTKADVLTAAEELMKMLTQYGLAEHTTSSLPRIWPQTLCANDGSFSIPTWTLQWDAPDSLYVLMDDASGKAFLLSLPCMGYSEKYLAKNGTEPIYAQAENWRAFLEDYYGTEVQLADEEWFDASARFALTFPLGLADGEKAEFQMELYIYFGDSFVTLSPYVSPVDLPPNQSTNSYDS